MEFVLIVLTAGGFLIGLGVVSHGLYRLIRQALRDRDPIMGRLL
jgi:hypothetical protein